MRRNLHDKSKAIMSCITQFYLKMSRNKDTNNRQKLSVYTFAAVLAVKVRGKYILYGLAQMASVLKQTIVDKDNCQCHSLGPFNFLPIEFAALHLLLRHRRNQEPLWLLAALGNT